MAMSITLQTIWDWANRNAGGITLLIFVIGILISIVWWFVVLIWKQYRLSHPFKIAEAYENYDFPGKRTLSYFEPIRIRCFEGQWHKDRINLYLEAKRKIDLKKINLRFVEKKVFGEPKDISPRILSIREIEFPQEKYYSNFTCYDDKKGGCDGVFEQPLNLSKGNVIFIEVYPKINIKEKKRCYISLDNSSGEEKRTFTRKKVVIANESIQ